MLDRLIPADDFPGALGAGVDAYVLDLLRGECAAEAAEIHAWLVRLEDETQFTSLGAPEQDSVLAACDARDDAVFARLVELAHEGFYADPGNGGNRDAVSWRMIGYETHVPR